MADFKQLTVNSGGTSVTYTVKDETARNGLSGKVAIAQGAGNAGKVMRVNSSGNLEPQEMSTESGIAIQLDFGTVSSFPQTINDVRITSDMVPIRYDIDNEEDVNGNSLSLSITTGSATLSGSLVSGKSVDVVIWIANNSNTAEFDELFERVEEINTTTLEPVQFTLSILDWSYSSGVYTATYLTDKVTETSMEQVRFGESIRNANGGIGWEKKSGGGGVVFTTRYIPTGAISGDIFVLDSIDGKTHILGVAGVANNVTTTEEGYVLDARQGKELHDQIATLKLESVVLTAGTNVNLTVYTKCYKTSELCILELTITTAGTISSGSTIASGFPVPRGGTTVNFMGGTDNSNNCFPFYIGQDGKLSCRTNLAQTSYYGSICYAI